MKDQRFYIPEEDFDNDDCQNDESCDCVNDSQTWGQESGLCDCADNCYGCPHAASCF